MSDTPPVRGLQTPAHVLVTGASSGVGLAATRVLLENETVARVFALARHAGESSALEALAATHGDRLLRLDADLTDDAARNTAIEVIADQTDALHVLFHAAGVLHSQGLQPEKALADVKADSLLRSFRLNAFAPILLAKALLPLLPQNAPGVLASLSARVGSIADNRIGGWYAYRASKAAQNQLWRTLAIELARTHRRVCCVLLHPGTVDTPLSQPFQRNVSADRLFTPDRAARQLLEIVARLEPRDSGRFIAWDGRDIPW